MERLLTLRKPRGIGHEGYGQGVAIGDVDNDGDADVYVTNYGADVFYRNNGDGRLLTGGRALKQSVGEHLRPLGL